MPKYELRTIPFSVERHGTEYKSADRFEDALSYGLAEVRDGLAKLVEEEGLEIVSHSLTLDQNGDYGIASFVVRY